jgi:mannose-1-phosphate guanylyltransferase
LPTSLAAQEGKKPFLLRLKPKDHEGNKLHRKVHRPWGTYTVLQESED